MSEVLPTIVMVAACQFMAPMVIADWPLFWAKIKVKDIIRRGADDFSEIKLSRFSSVVYKYDTPQHLPERTIIKYDVEYTDDQLSGGLLTLDHENGTVNRMNTVDILHRHDGGSGELGLFIIGLPGIILFSPLLILNGLVWAVVERIAGMNRHALTAYCKIRNQVDPETRALLKAALQKDFQNG